MAASRRRQAALARSRGGRSRAAGAATADSRSSCRCRCVLRWAWSCVAPRHPERVLVEDVLVGRVGPRRADVRMAGEGLGVARRVTRARRAPLGQVRQLGQQHGRLQRVQPAVEARPRRGSTACCPPCSRSRRSRSASASSCVTIMPPSPNAPRFLLGKNDRVPTVPSSPATRQVAVDLAPRADGLRRVLDQREPVPRGDGAPALHRRHLAEEVHRDDGAGPRT